MPILFLTALSTTGVKRSGWTRELMIKPLQLMNCWRVCERASSSPISQPDVLQIDDLKIDKQQQITVTRAGKNIDLTNKNMRLLEYLMQHRIDS